MPNVWVHPTLGNDSNTGLTPYAPFLTISHAQTIAGGGSSIINLMPGDYIDQPISPQANSVVGHGLVRFISTVGGTAITFSSSIQSVVRDIQFFGWDTVIASTSFAVLLIQKVIAHRPSPGGIFCQGFSASIMNCTVMNYQTIVKRIATGGFLDYMRNTFIDGFTTLEDYTAFPIVAGPASVYGLRIDYNAWDGNTDPHGVDITGVSRSLLLNDPSGLPYPNLSIKKDTSILAEAGEHRDIIGTNNASFESSKRLVEVPAPQSFSSTLFPLWTGWTNDESHYNTTTHIGENAGASPAILTATLGRNFEPKSWLIDDNYGGRLSARVLGPVLDAGHAMFNPKLLGISWWGDENLTADGYPADETINNSNSLPVQIEYRASNNRFSQTATNTGDIEWTFIGKTDVVNVSRRFFQFRVKLQRSVLT